jgi:hypothetical protein
LRRNAGVTVQWLRRNADAVETGNCVADEQADRFNNGLGGQICRSAWVRNKPTAEVRQRLTRKFKLRNVYPIFQRKLTEAVMHGAKVEEITIADNLTPKQAYELEYRHLKKMVNDGKRNQLWNTIPPSICTPQEHEAYVKKLTVNATSKDRLTRCIAHMQLIRLGRCSSAPGHRFGAQAKV